MIRFTPAILALISVAQAIELESKTETTTDANQLGGAIAHKIYPELLPSPSMDHGATQYPMAPNDPNFGPLPGHPDSGIAYPG